MSDDATADKPMFDEPSSYQAAEEELTQILTALEADDLDVDQLSDAVARARALIQWCRQRLARTEVAITELLEEDPEA